MSKVKEKSINQSIIFTKLTIKELKFETNC